MRYLNAESAPHATLFKYACIEENNYLLFMPKEDTTEMAVVDNDDEKNKGGELQQLFGFTAENKMDDGDSDALQENDALRIEVRAIDRASYDYLYSMQVMGSAGTNPIPNFTGGCLGYFSAYSYTNLRTKFHRNEIEEQ